MQSALVAIYLVAIDATHLACLALHSVLFNKLASRAPAIAKRISITGTNCFM